MNSFLHLVAHHINTTRVICLSRLSVYGEHVSPKSKEETDSMLPVSSPITMSWCVTFHRRGRVEWLPFPSSFPCYCLRPVSHGDKWSLQVHGYTRLCLVFLFFFPSCHRNSLHVFQSVATHEDDNMIPLSHPSCQVKRQDERKETVLYITYYI